MYHVPESTLPVRGVSWIGVLLIGFALAMIFGGDRTRRTILFAVGSAGLAIFLLFCVATFSYRSAGTARLELPAGGFIQFAETPQAIVVMPEPPPVIEPLPPRKSVTAAKALPSAKPSESATKPSGSAKQPASKQPQVPAPPAPPSPDVRSAPSVAPQPRAVPEHHPELTFEVQRAEIERQWREVQLSRRLWHLSSAAALVLILVTSGLAYLKIDLKTEGRYRRHLRLVTGAAILASTVLAAYGWDMPWRG